MIVAKSSFFRSGIYASGPRMPALTVLPFLPRTSPKKTSAHRASSGTHNRDIPVQRFRCWIVNQEQITHNCCFPARDQGRGCGKSLLRIAN